MGAAILTTPDLRARVLTTLREWTGADREGLVMASELCRALAVEPMHLDAVLRSMAAEGEVICAPGSGRIAVVALTRRARERGRSGADGAR